MQYYLQCVNTEQYRLEMMMSCFVLGALGTRTRAPRQDAEPSELSKPQKLEARTEQIDMEKKRMPRQDSRNESMSEAK